VGGRDVTAIAGRAEEFLAAARGRPFYLHVGFADPHRDFDNARPHPGVTEVRYAPEDVVVPPFLPDIPAVRTELAQYYQAISRLDAGIGLVLAALERSGRAGETLVLCLSDHGMPFPGAKASPFDSGHHCPLVVRHPERGRGGVVNDALVNWCNLAPTVFDWCGVQAPEGLPERSFLPVLGEAHPRGWEETYFSHTFHEVTNYFPYRALRARRYKYVRTLFPELTMPLPSDLWASPTWRAVRAEGIAMLGRRPTARCLHHDAEALFDVGRDPVEAENRIGDPALAGVAAEMRAKVQAFRQATADPWVLASEQGGEVFPRPAGAG
jgi:N-sulfoglucosamine sulfohydrolase